MEDAVNILEKFWPLLILIAFFYFSMYRPQKKLRLERKRFLLSLRKGNHVVTSSGIYGVIKVLRDKYVELEIAPKVVICLLYTSDAADELDGVDLGGRRIIKKKFFQAEDGIRDQPRSRGLGDVYKRQEKRKRSRVASV